MKIGVQVMEGQEVWIRIKEKDLTLLKKMIKENLIINNVYSNFGYFGIMVLHLRKKSGLFKISGYDTLSSYLNERALFHFSEDKLISLSSFASTSTLLLTKEERK